MIWLWMIRVNVGETLKERLIIGVAASSAIQCRETRSKIFVWIGSSCRKCVDGTSSGFSRSVGQVHFHMHISGRFAVVVITCEIIIFQFFGTAIVRTVHFGGSRGLHRVRSSSQLYLPFSRCWLEGFLTILSFVLGHLAAIFDEELICDVFNISSRLIINSSPAWSNCLSQFYERY